EGAHRKVGGENCAALAPCHYLSADADDPAFAGLEMIPDVAVVTAAIGLGHEYVHVLARELSLRETEHSFGRGIDAANDSLGINDDDGADRGLEHLRAMTGIDRLAFIHRRAPTRRRQWVRRQPNKGICSAARGPHARETAFPRARRDPCRVHAGIAAVKAQGPTPVRRQAVRLFGAGLSHLTQQL